MTMTTRRTLLGAGLAASAVLCAPALLRAAPLASRRYRIFRGNDEIGLQTVQLLRSGDRLRVEIGIDIRVRIFGITAYRYEMLNVEHWAGGRLVDMDARTNDDGTRHQVAVTRRDGALRVAGTGFEGEVTADAATTTYWSPDFLSRPVWISTHDGTPLNVATARRGVKAVDMAAGSVQADRWAVTGDLDLELFYAGREWVANHFAARGETARIVAEDTATPLAPLFTA
jgi:hypothetical protein